MNEDYGEGLPPSSTYGNQQQYNNNALLSKVPTPKGIQPPGKRDDDYGALPAFENDRQNYTAPISLQTNLPRPNQNLNQTISKTPPRDDYSELPIMPSQKGHGAGGVKPYGDTSLVAVQVHNPSHSPHPSPSQPKHKMTLTSMANGTATALQRKNSQQHDEYNALPPSLDDKLPPPSQFNTSNNGGSPGNAIPGQRDDDYGALPDFDGNPSDKHQQFSPPPANQYTNMVSATQQQQQHQHQQPNQQPYQQPNQQQPNQQLPQQYTNMAKSQYVSHPEFSGESNANHRARFGTAPQGRAPSKTLIVNFENTRPVNLPPIADFPVRGKTFSQPKSEFVAAIEMSHPPATQADKDLYEKMKSSLSLHDKTFLHKTYKRCFSGKEAVDWMVNNNITPSREDGLERGKSMFQSGLFVKAKIPELKKLASKGIELAQSKIQNKERVKKVHIFKDDKNVYYRFKEDIELSNLVDDDPLAQYEQDKCHINLANKDISGAQWKELKDLKIPSLDVSNSPSVTDYSISIIGDLISLTYLNLSGTKITNHSLDTITKLYSLRSLDISNTYITDVSPLVKLTNLKLLDFRDPKTVPSKVAIQTLVEFFEKMKKEKTYKEGWLTKQGGRIKTWKRRWMTIEDGKLYYKETPDIPDFKGFVDLKEPGIKIGIADELTDKEFCFKIETSTRTYYIQAPSRDEMLIWLEAILFTLRYQDFRVLTGGRDSQQQQ